MSSEDEFYKDHIRHLLGSFNKEIEEGRGLLAETSLISLTPGASLETCKAAVEEQRGRLEAQDHLLIEKILALANTTILTHETVELATGRRRLLGMEELYFLFLEKNKEAFQFENPYLTDEQVAALQQLLFESLLIKTSLQHIDRLAPLWEAGDLQAIGKAASQQRSYDPLKYPEYVVFEYFSNIRLYPQQTALLEALEEKDSSGHYASKVGQLMMGGGKTKVLSALLLYASSRPDHLPLLVVPSSLYNVVYQDLSAALSTNLDRVVIPLEFTRETLTNSFVTILERRLEDAMKLGQVILIKSEALQALRLQYISEHDEALRLKKSLSPLGQRLGAILQLLHDKADTLIDEVHLVLAQKQEVNFPVGDEILVEGQYVDTLQTIFQEIAADPLLSSALREDRQPLISDEEFKAQTRPLIARLLSEGKIGKDSGIAADKLAAYLQGEPVEEVERQLADLHKNPKTSHIANQLALSRYILRDLLLKNFKRSCGRHFGPLPAAMATEHSPVGKIVPYQAVGTPATTVFASWEEETVFGFMTTFRLPIQQDSFDFLIKKINTSGLSAAAINEFNNLIKKVTRTEDGKELSLFAMEKAENRAIALARINASIQNRLLIQAEFLKFTVNFHSERISSNPQDWDFRAIRALSGTPYNRLCYTKDLGKHIVSDPAVEGKIIAACFAKAALRPDIIHKSEAKEAGALLDGLIRDETKGRVHGLQDPGGVFKEQDNFEVARAFNRVIKARGLGLQGTIFFWKKPGMATADQLAFLPADRDVPIALKGSSKEALREQGLDIDRLFIYYDEKHCTGTDLPQPADSINYVTLDYHQDITTTLQSILRLRQYVTGSQEVEFVIPSDRAEKMPADLAGLFAHLIKNLAVDQSRQFYQALVQRVDAIFKEAMLHELLTCSDESKRSTIYEALRPYYVESSTSDPFMTYGMAPKLIDPLALLEKRISDKWAKCSYDSPTFKKRVEEGLTKLLSIRSQDEMLRALPAKVTSPAHIKEGTVEEVSLEKETVRAQQVEVEVELQVELQRVYAKYQSESKHEQDLVPFDTKKLDSIPLERGPAFAVSLQEAMKTLDADYSSCFSDNIKVAGSFTDLKHPYSIFARFHKPAHQIVVECDEGGAWTFMLISGDDADKMKTEIDSLTTRRKNVWLIDDRGNYLTSLKEGQLADPVKHIEVQKALIQLAAFNGNVSYLLDHKELALEWLNTPIEESQKKRRLIALKAMKEPSQVVLLSRSPEFNQGICVKKDKVGEGTIGGSLGPGGGGGAAAGTIVPSFAPSRGGGAAAGTIASSFTPSRGGGAAAGTIASSFTPSRGEGAAASRVPPPPSFAPSRGGDAAAGRVPPPPSFAPSRDEGAAAGRVPPPPSFAPSRGEGAAADRVPPPPSFAPSRGGDAAAGRVPPPPSFAPSRGEGAAAGRVPPPPSFAPSRGGGAAAGRVPTPPFFVPPEIGGTAAFDSLGGLQRSTATVPLALPATRGLPGVAPGVPLAPIFYTPPSGPPSAPE